MIVNFLPLCLAEADINDSPWKIINILVQMQTNELQTSRLFYKGENQDTVKYLIVVFISTTAADMKYREDSQSSKGLCKEDDGQCLEISPRIIYTSRHFPAKILDKHEI